MLDALIPRYAAAQQVSPSDPRLETGYVDTVRRKGMAGRAATWRVRPAPRARCRVLVVHENRGLNPHIEDVARRLAVEHSWRLRPMHDPLGYPGDDDKAVPCSGRSITPRR